MYWFNHDNNSNIDGYNASIDYMHSGRALAHFLKDHLCVHPPSNNEFSLLDFASGYGRVSRWMNEAMPNAQVYASDIHQDAVNFMRSIGINAFKSSSKPNEFNSPCHFDVIFSVSFFTHLPKSTWGRWLKSLEEYLNPGGLLIFTTHGDPIWHALGSPAVDKEGFYFRPESEQKDLDVTEYGATYTSLEFVLTRAREVGLRVEGVRSPGTGLHDIVTLRKVDRSTFPPAYSRTAPLRSLKRKFLKRVLR
ncbi:class I SAM-dependent methyltransferase [Methylobacterium sp. WL93]|nr:class I SAM-dependent methyltransferase [Methylobacterium sp. WL93]